MGGIRAQIPPLKKKGITNEEGGCRVGQELKQKTQKARIMYDVINEES